jgi:putative ATP-dependent endonuclease of OLD family
VDVKPDEDGNYKNKSEKKIEKKRKKYSKDNVKAFITPYWTLEYTLALSGLSEIFYQAVYICDKTRNDDYKYDESDIKEYIKQANEIYKKWKEEKTNKEIAYEIYKKTIISKRISKVAVAQVFAKLLIDNSESVKDIILKDEYLIYLIDAIKYVTSGSNDSNNR